MAISSIPREIWKANILPQMESEFLLFIELTSKFFSTLITEYTQAKATWENYAICSKIYIYKPSSESSYKTVLLTICRLYCKVTMKTSEINKTTLALDNLLLLRKSCYDFNVNWQKNNKSSTAKQDFLMCCQEMAKTANSFEMIQLFRLGLDREIIECEEQFEAIANDEKQYLAIVKHRARYCQPSSLEKKISFQCSFLTDCTFTIPGIQFLPPVMHAFMDCLQGHPFELPSYIKCFIQKLSEEEFDLYVEDCSGYYPALISHVALISNPCSDHLYTRRELFDNALELDAAWDILESYLEGVYFKKPPENLEDKVQALREIVSQRQYPLQFPTANKTIKQIFNRLAALEKQQSEEEKQLRLSFVEALIKADKSVAAWKSIIASYQKQGLIVDSLTLQCLYEYGIKHWHPYPWESQLAATLASYITHPNIDMIFQQISRRAYFFTEHKDHQSLINKFLFDDLTLLVQNLSKDEFQQLFNFITPLSIFVSIRQREKDLHSGFLIFSSDLSFLEHRFSIDVAKSVADDIKAVLVGWRASIQ